MHAAGKANMSLTTKSYKKIEDASRVLQERSEPPVITLDDSDEEVVCLNIPRALSRTEAEKINDKEKSDLKKRRQERWRKQKRENLARNQDQSISSEYFQEDERKSKSKRHFLKSNKNKSYNTDRQVSRNNSVVSDNRLKSYQRNEMRKINAVSNVETTLINDKVVASSPEASTANLKANAFCGQSSDRSSSGTCIIQKNIALTHQERVAPSSNKNTLKSLPENFLETTTNFVSCDVKLISKEHSKSSMAVSSFQNISADTRAESTVNVSRESDFCKIAHASSDQQKGTPSKYLLQAGLNSPSSNTCKSPGRQTPISSFFKPSSREIQFNGLCKSPNSQTQSNGPFKSPKTHRKTYLPKTSKTCSPKSPKVQIKKSSSTSPKVQKRSSPKSPKTQKQLNSSSPFKHWQSSSQPSLLGRKDIWKTGSHSKRKLNFGVENKNDVPLSEDKLLVPQSIRENYHVRYFSILFEEVLKDESARNCINEEEINVIRTFLSLENDVKEFFLRIYTRKFQWRRVADIKYEEKFNLDSNECIQRLKNHNFFETDNSALDLESLLELMRVPELKEFCKSLGMKLKGSTKLKLSEEIIKYSKSQKTFSLQFGFKMTSCEENLKEKLRKLIGPCFKLNSDVRNLYRRLELCFRMMFSREGESASETSAVSQLYFLGTDTKIYPSYHIDKTIKVFSCRDDLLRFEEAVELESALTAAVEQKLLSVAEDVIKKIRVNFVSELRSEDFCSKASNLPLSLRRFSAGSSLAYSLYLGLEVLPKLDKRSEAINDLYLLLGQQVYLPYYRGQWYNQLVNFLNACGRYNEVTEVLLKGLKDDFTIEKHRYDLQLCCQKLSRKKKVPAEVKAILGNIAVPDLRVLPDVCIKAKALDGIVGRKTVYVLDDVETQGTTYSSVEELAINYYKSKGYSKGFHVENSVAMTLFGVLMWNIIYEYPVPYVFRTPYQIKPLDLDSGEFYTNRRIIIDEQLKVMENWSESEVYKWIRNVYESHKGKTCVVNWTLFETAEDFWAIVSCMGWRVALKICERLAKCYQSSRSGFPDLVLWTPQEKKCLFVEVKGQNDRLSTVQKLWLNYLMEIGADANLCFVTTVGGRPLKRKKQTAESCA